MFALKIDFLKSIFLGALVLLTGIITKNAHETNENSDFINCYNNFLNNYEQIDLNYTFNEIMEKVCISENDTFLNVIDKFNISNVYSIESIASKYNINMNYTIYYIENLYNQTFIQLLSNVMSKHENSLSDNGSKLFNISAIIKLFHLNSAIFIETINIKFINLSSEFNLSKNISIEENLKLLDYEPQDSIIHFIDDYIQPITIKFVDLLMALKIPFDTPLSELDEDNINLNATLRLTDWLKSQLDSVMQLLFIDSSSKSKFNVVTSTSIKIPSTTKPNNITSNTTQNHNITTSHNRAYGLDSESEIVILQEAKQSNITELTFLVDLIQENFLDLNITLSDIVDRFNYYINEKLYCNSDEYHNDSVLCPQKPSTPATNNSTNAVTIGITDELISIYNGLELINIDNQTNIEYTSSYLENVVTNNNKSYSSSDLNLLSMIIDKIVDKLEIIPLNITQDLLNIISGIMDSGLAIENQTLAEISLNRIFHVVEGMGEKVQIGDEASAQELKFNSSKANGAVVSNKNLGLCSIKNLQESDEFLVGGGGSIAPSDVTIFTSSDVNKLNDIAFTNNVVASFEIDRSKLSPGDRISFVLTNNTLFNYFDDLTYVPASYALSIQKFPTNNSVSTISTSNVENFVRISFRKLNNDTDFDYKCGWWDFNILDWSTDGCITVKENTSDIYTCRCNHTTFFALLAEPESASTELSLIFTILTSFSIAFALAIAILFIMKLRTMNYQFIDRKPAFYTMLSALGCTLSYVVASVLTIGVVYNTQTENNVGCAVLGAFTHFFILVYFCWLFIAVLMHYFTVQFKLNLFTKTFKISSALSFAIPFIIALVVFIVDRVVGTNSKCYTIQNKICWLNKDLRIGVLVVPICIIVAANIVFLGLIIFGKVRNRKKVSVKNYFSANRLSSTRRDLVTITGCILFSGISWIGLPFALIDRSAAIDGLIYAFSIVNALQGIFIFVHFVITIQIILNPKVVQSRIKSFKIFNFSTNNSMIIDPSDMDSHHSHP